MTIENEDQRSKDYSEIAGKFRPGHADYTYLAKYGIRDHRGGGRSSARETAMRVAAGAVARKVLDHVLPAPVTIRGALVQMGPHADRPIALGLGPVRAQSLLVSRRRRGRRMGRTFSTPPARRAPRPVR